MWNKGPQQSDTYLKEADMNSANLVAIIFYALIASLLLLLVVWSFIASFRRRSSSIRESTTESMTSHSTNHSRGTSNSLVSRMLLDEFPVRSYQLPPNKSIKVKEQTQSMRSESLSDRKKEGEQINPKDSDQPCLDDTLMKRATDGSLTIQIDNPQICDEQELCVICLEEYQQEDRIRELPCAHFYHKTCIDPWLTQISPMCPLCKMNSINLWAELNTIQVPARSATFPRTRWRRYLSVIRCQTRESLRRPSTSSH